MNDCTHIFNTCSTSYCRFGRTGSLDVIDVTDILTTKAVMLLCNIPALFFKAQFY